MLCCMELNQIIGKNIAAFRRKLGYTQTDISNYLGISQPAYADYEYGKTTISMVVMEKLAILYGIEEYDLMEENFEMLQTSLACAYRKEGNITDLTPIAQFQKIVKNYIQMCDELEK